MEPVGQEPAPQQVTECLLVCLDPLQKELCVACPFIISSRWIDATEGDLKLFRVKKTAMASEAQTKAAGTQPKTA